MTTELVELAEAWEAEANQMDDDPDIFACLPHAVRQCATELRALASRAGGWRTIDSAPTSIDPMLGDVKDCLVYGPEVGRKMGRAWRYPDGRAKAQAYGFHGEWEITHWQPLPEPPAAPEPVAVGSNNLSNDEEESP